MKLTKGFFLGGKKSGCESGQNTAFTQEIANVDSFTRCIWDGCFSLWTSQPAVFPWPAWSKPTWRMGPLPPAPGPYTMQVQSWGQEHSRKQFQWLLSFTGVLSYRFFKPLYCPRPSHITLCSTVSPSPRKAAANAGKKQREQTRSTPWTLLPRGWQSCLVTLHPATDSPVSPT